MVRKPDEADRRAPVGRDAGVVPVLAGAGDGVWVCGICGEGVG